MGNASQLSTSAVILPDGAQLAYDVLGENHLASKQPIVLVGGMSSVRHDWERLATKLSESQPVLIFDHRGMGDSRFTSSSKDDITLESMARDLLYLIHSLNFKTVSICGFSMGGLVAQQLLFLPYLPNNPTPLPFQISHVFLTATGTSILRDKRYGLRFQRPPSQGLVTVEDRREFVRPTVESLFDPQWLADPRNSERLRWWLDRMTVGRPLRTILSQARACADFDFSGLYEKVSPDIRIMIIHGELDAVLPFSGQAELLERFPWATSLEVGPSPGQVPNLAFGHQWFEYFDIQVWSDVLEKFIATAPARARL